MFHKTMLFLFLSLMVFWTDASAQKRDLSNLPLLLDAKSSAPPPGPVRHPAEFEPMTGVLIRYPLGVPHSLILEMAKDAEVVTIVKDKGEQGRVEKEYGAHGINLKNCSFLIAPSDTHWTRDVGPWFIITGNNEQGIANNKDPWGGIHDDLIPVEFGKAHGIPVYDTGVCHEGGNYMTDGQGTAFSLDLLFNYNPNLTKQDIFDRANDYLGIKNYRIIWEKPSIYFFHIDCCAKLLAPNKVMVLKTPPTHPRHQFLEDLVVYFKGLVSCYGTPYKIYRVYSHNKEAYANSLILNHKVLLPFEGNKWDQEAVLAYQAAMPGYEVQGFTGNWSPFDALHCRTMGVTDRYMLYINHTPILDRPSDPKGFLVEAEIIPYSNTSVKAEVVWKTIGTWNSIALNPVGGHHYQGHIPAQPLGAKIHYYIHAHDGSGRKENHPYIGAPDPHVFYCQAMGESLNMISQKSGGVVDLYLSGGASNGGRDYMVLGSASGTTPGIVLPSGQVLPLNWDGFTDLTYLFTNSVFFQNFNGVLDAHGLAAARFDTQGQFRHMLGVTLNFAFLCTNPMDFVSNSVGVTIVE